MCHNPQDTNSANPIRDLVAGFMCCTLSGIILAIDWLLVNTMLKLQKGRILLRGTGIGTISKSTISYLRPLQFNYLSYKLFLEKKSYSNIFF